MEKEPDSMATVQMKADYAASEVYSTASEAPPVSVFHLAPIQSLWFQCGYMYVAYKIAESNYSFLCVSHTIWLKLYDDDKLTRCACEQGEPHTSYSIYG